MFFDSLLTLTPDCKARLGLRPAPLPAPLDLIDARGEVGVVMRCWRMRPYSYDYSPLTPMIRGSELLLRPDLAEVVLTSTNGGPGRSPSSPRTSCGTVHDSSVHFLKLHGSIDWFDVDLRDASAVASSERSARDIEHLAGFDVRSNRPEFLAGMFTTILETTWLDARSRARFYPNMSVAVAVRRGATLLVGRAVV